MAETTLTLPDGTIVTITGTPEEVTAIVQRISGATSSQSSRSAPRRSSSRREPAGARPGRAAPKGPIDYIRDLAISGFFDTPQSLGDVRKALAERGHIYPPTSLSPALVRLVRRREIRRLQENGRWRYVNA